MKASTAIRYLERRAEWLREWGKIREESAARLAIVSLRSHGALVAACEAAEELNSDQGFFDFRSVKAVRLMAVAALAAARSTPPANGENP